MQAVLVFLCLALPAVALGGAEVYRWVDDDGQVHYSDRPSPGADRVVIEVAPPSSSPAPGVASAQTPSPTDDKPAAAAYESLTIRSPGQDEVLWNIEGQLDVAVAPQPALQRGHTLQLLLDGQPVAELEPGTTRTRLSDVYRGRHTLVARIQDGSGSTLIQSAPVTFQVQQSALGANTVVNPPPPVVPQPRVRPLASAPQPADILGSITTAIIGINAEGIVNFLNPGAEDLLALSARHGLGRPLQALLPQLRNLHELVQRAATEGQSFGQLLSVAVPRQGPAANDVAVRVSPSRNGDGNLIVELFDATQWRQIDRERALISQHDASRRMIRQLAHEIRNPLGGLRGAAQLLERELPTPELREYTRIIIGEADRLTALTDSLLGPIRQPQWQPVNLHEILERVIALIASEQHDAVRLVRDYDPSLPPLSADPDQLIQSFLNVARNAMQAVGPDGHIVFRTRVLSNFAIGQIRHKLVASIEIEDDGPGIPAEIADSIFYPLVTGRADGTGLGLPISQDLVSRHGGLIEFQSRPGKTVFMVRLPINTEVTEMA